MEHASSRRPSTHPSNSPSPKHLPTPLTSLRKLLGLASIRRAAISGSSMKVALACGQQGSGEEGEGRRVWCCVALAPGSCLPSFPLPPPTQRFTQTNNLPQNTHAPPTHPPTQPAPTSS
jgi:hypothetical protein